MADNRRNLKFCLKTQFVYCEHFVKIMVYIDRAVHTI